MISRTMKDYKQQNIIGKASIHKHTILTQRFVAVIKVIFRHFYSLYSIYTKYSLDFQRIGILNLKVTNYFYTKAF